MAKNLVIVESPAKAKTIEKFLGKDFKVQSSFGHIADLPSKELGVDVDGDFTPKYIVSSDKKKLVATNFFLSLETIYFGVKSPSTSTPSSLEGRSAMCPKLDCTLKSFPKNFSIVFAFAGDSTITKFFAIVYLYVGYKSM